MDFQGRIVKSKLQTLLAGLPAMGAVVARVRWRSCALTASFAAFSGGFVRAISPSFQASLAFAAGLTRQISRGFQAALQGLAATLASWLRFSTPAERVVRVEFESRRVEVPRELRLVVVEYEQRVAAT
jgi:hypothetical protein